MTWNYESTCIRTDKFKSLKCIYLTREIRYREFFEKTNQLCLCSTTTIIQNHRWQGLANMVWQVTNYLSRAGWRVSRKKDLLWIHLYPLSATCSPPLRPWHFHKNILKMSHWYNNMHSKLAWRSYSSFLQLRCKKKLQLIHNIFKWPLLEASKCVQIIKS